MRAPSDYELGFDRHLPLGTGLFVPWAWLTLMFMRDYGPKDLIKPQKYDARGLLASKVRFCAFFYGNCGDPGAGVSTERRRRNSFFQLLSSYKFVHAPGRCQHNFDDPQMIPKDQGDWVDNYQNAVEYYRQYKECAFRSPPFH